MLSHLYCVDWGTARAHNSITNDLKSKAFGCMYTGHYVRTARQWYCVWFATGGSGGCGGADSDGDGGCSSGDSKYSNRNTTTTNENTNRRQTINRFNQVKLKQGTNISDK